MAGSRSTGKNRKDKVPSVIMIRNTMVVATGRLIEVVVIAMVRVLV
jgi:hypothetical protein